MPLVLKDRVKETSTTTGTGTFTLAGASTGFQAFSVIGDGNPTYYTITDGTDWEVGIGTYTSSGTTLSRDTILESSNAGSAVNWGAGSKDVFVTYPAEKSVNLDAAGDVNGYDIENSPIGATTPAAATFTTLTATGQTSLGGAAGSESLRVLSVASSTRWIQASGSASGTVSLSSNAASGNIDFALWSRASGVLRLGTAGGTEQFRVSHTASAVNYVQVTGAATSGSPVISAQGSDANVNLTLTSKGTFGFSFRNSSNGLVASITHGGSSTPNYIGLSATVSGSAPSVIAAGSDTNIDLALTPKGTGLLRFGTHTAIGSTTFSIDGYIQIKDSAGNIRKLAVLV